MPPDTPPQHKVSMPLRDTSPTSLALGPYSVRKSRISFYNFRDSVCCLTSLPVRLLKFPGVHDCERQGNLSSPEFSICTAGAQCFISPLFTSLIHPVASSPPLSRSHFPAAPTGYLFAVAFALPFRYLVQTHRFVLVTFQRRKSLLAFRSTENSVWYPPPPAQGTCCPLWIVGGRRFNTKNWFCSKVGIKVFGFRVQGLGLC